MSTILEGFAASDPVGKQLNGGKYVAEFRLSFKVSKDAKTEFISVKAWGDVGGWVAATVRKGDLLTAIGQIRIETWEDATSGQKREKAILSARVVAIHHWHRRPDPYGDGAPRRPSSEPIPGTYYADGAPRAGGYGRPAGGYAAGAAGAAGYGSGPGPFPDEGQNQY